MLSSDHTYAILCSHQQLDILKAALQEKSNVVASVARCLQYLHHCCKKLNSINILQHCPGDLVVQNLPLATRVTFWFHNPCNIKKSCVANTSKNVPRVAAAELHCEKCWVDSTECFVPLFWEIQTPICT